MRRALQKHVAASTLCKTFNNFFERYQGIRGAHARRSWLSASSRRRSTADALVAIHLLALPMHERSAASEQQLSAYIAQRPGDAQRLHILLAQRPLRDALFARTTFPGHITASGFVVARDSRSILLIAHKRLGRLLQPGGHIESSDASLTHAAMREVREETSLDVEPLLVAPPQLVDIDIHTIPAGRGEPEHDHYDFRFCFMLGSQQSLTPQLAEVHRCLWARIDSADVLGALGERSVQRVQETLSSTHS